MAFASAISLENTIERLLNSSRISIVSPSREIIETAYKELESLQEILKRLDGSSKSSSRKRENALDQQIKEKVCELEDLLESHVLNQVLSQSETESPRDGIQFSIDLQDLRQDVDSFFETVKKMEEEYVKVLDSPLAEEDDGAAVSSSTCFGGNKSKLIGLSNLLSKIINQLTVPRYPGFPIFSLIGMAGVGKTTLAKEIFEYPDILEYFDCRVWVTVGRKCQVNEIPRSILVQVDPDLDEMLTGRDEEIVQYLYEIFKCKRYLIVLDDVWDTEVWDCLKNSFTYGIDEGSRVLLTTRLQEVYQHTKVYSFGIENVVRLLNKKESWDLLCEKVFGEDSCPLQLEKAGKKIAENCDGLPLMIITVANILSKAEKTTVYWNKVAEKQNTVFMDAYDEISEVLFPSYHYLPQHLKPCFLHMGVFPQKYEIPRSNLFDMWIVEGFLKPDRTQTLEDCAKEYLEELVSNSVVIVRKNCTNLSHGIKTCRLHSSLWHLCNSEAEKNKFFHVLNSYADGLEEGMKSQRRLCLHNNILLGIEDVYNSVGDACASTARSLLCFGPYHQYPVPICCELRLLRVLDALKIHLYEFPLEVLQLVQLRYLALTCNENLPTSISKLWNLQFLIINRHLSIISCEDSPYVPIEIWDMQELKHIQIVGSDLPNSNGGTSLKDLSTLLGVSIHSCNKGVLKRISNLKKLGIQIELVPDDDSVPFGCLNSILCLRKLQSLKCVVVNPELGSEFVAPPAPHSMFPSSLRKLHLSGLGYPWEYMSIIGSLPHLDVLKLRNYAFCGPNWEINENEFKFRMLRFLEIEDSDLVQWKVGIGSFPRLRNLSIKHCYNLEEFHWEFDYFFKKIEIVDSNPLAVTFIDQIKSRRGRIFRDVNVHCSWDDGKLRS